MQDTQWNHAFGRLGLFSRRRVKDLVFLLPDMLRTVCLGHLVDWKKPNILWIYPDTLFFLKKEKDIFELPKMTQCLPFVVLFLGFVCMCVLLLLTIQSIIPAIFLGVGWGVASVAVNICLLKIAPNSHARA